MNDELVVGLTVLAMSGILLGLGLYARFLPLILFSLFFIAIGFYHLYRGIPLELRERRHRARLKRWEKLDEEESET